MKLTAAWTASALGVGNRETMENYRRRVAVGMKEIEGDIPSRKIWFGMVPGELPRIDERKWDMRSNRLLKLAVENMPELKTTVMKYGAKRVGIVLGASNTGSDEAQNYVEEWLDRGAKPEKLDFSMIELGTPAKYLQGLLGIEGPVYVISTACSSSTKAFAVARRLIEKEVCDAVITGGVDGRCRFAMNGFHALGALSQGKCRPLAEDRDGINLGEGVALFTLEREGEGVTLAGIGESSDAYHATAPDPEGKGAEMAMRAALQDAGIKPEQIKYLNLHGTGTQANDSMELKAVKRIFGEQLPSYESTKELTGHCLGAAGAIEAAICWLRIYQGEVESSLSNSFAFGGSNASVIFTR